MPTSKDYYETLGVPRSASADEIKRAYRKLAKKYHPDTNKDGDAEIQFKRVQSAYNTLKDEKKRQEYDQFGAAGVGQWQTDPRGQQVYQWGPDSSIKAEDLEDLYSAFSGPQNQRPSIFDQLFGQRGPQRPPPPQPTRGRDEIKEIKLSWQQAVNGATVTVRLGHSHKNQKESLEVKIPAGVEDAQKIRLRGRGHPGAHSGPAGDFILVCKIQPHPFFTRRGSDILLDVPISAAEAALGIKVEIPTITGKTLLTVPPATQHGAKLRLRGMGLHKTEGQAPGDFFAVVRIVWPHELSDKQRQLYEELHKYDQPSVRQDLGWWKD